MISLYRIDCVGILIRKIINIDLRRKIERFLFAFAELQPIIYSIIAVLRFTIWNQREEPGRKQMNDFHVFL